MTPVCQYLSCNQQPLNVLFPKQDPERFFNMGVAEANILDIAGGMATCGRRSETESITGARKKGRILTVDEQTVLGGVGTAVAEASGRLAPTELDCVGLRGCFETGPRVELLATHSNSAGEIISLERRVFRGVSA